MRQDKRNRSKTGVKGTTGYKTKVLTDKVLVVLHGIH